VRSMASYIRADFFKTIICLLSLILPQSSFAGGGGGGGGSSPYIDLNPAFVVNLTDNDSGIRYLQIAVSVKLQNESYADRVKKHMPMIRHNLVLLFSGLNYDEIKSQDGKLLLTNEVLKVTQEKLKKVTGKALVEEVYLTKIVGQ